MKPYGSLDNYISALRKESGLLQDELAILLGLGGRSAVSRYESSEDIPDLARLIALEIIFHEPIQKIFAGIAEEVRENVTGRAQALLEGMGEKTTAQNAQKLDTLARLAHLDEAEPTPWEHVA